VNSLVLLDSSVICEWLQVPGKSSINGQKMVSDEMKVLLSGGATFYLPLAAVVEVGNHITHVKNGVKRRTCAERFVTLLNNCLNHERPYATIPFWDEDDMRKFAAAFSANATAGVSMGDTTMINDFNKLCEVNPTAKCVRIWSVDGHLDSYRCLRF